MSILNFASTFLSQYDQYEQVSIVNHNCFDKFKVVLLFLVGGRLLIISTCYFLDSLARD